MKFRSTPVVALGEFILGLVLSVVLIPFPMGARPPAASPALPDTIRGIRIHYQYDAAAFFPSGWRREPVDCHGLQVDTAEAQRAVPLIRQFASTYSASTLHDHLTDIFLLRDLNCYGKSYGGTNSTASIYLRVGRVEQGYDAQHLLSTMHAEFSSILWRNHQFPTEQWKAANPTGFEYPNNSVAVLEEAGITDQPSRHLFCGGFLTRYGTADLENDFNEYAGAMLVEPQQLCQHQVKCSAIAEKARLAIQFYKSVDPMVEIPGCK